MAVSRRSMLAGCGFGAAVGVLLALAVAPAHAVTMADPAATTPSTASSAATTTVTERDSQTTVTLLVGQTLAVTLGANYDPPAVGGPALVQLSISGGYPTGRPLVATYRAVAPGAVDVRTQTDYACLHTVPRCALPQYLWTVHVEIVSAMAGSSPPPSSRGSSPSITPVGDWPVVWITGPLMPNTSFIAPATIPITASARTDRASTITKIDFYANGKVVAADTTAPYGFTWTGVPAGSYQLYARAHDDRGRAANSTTTSVYVSPGPPVTAAA